MSDSTIDATVLDIVAILTAHHNGHHNEGVRILGETITRVGAAEYIGAMGYIIGALTDRLSEETGESLVEILQPIAISVAAKE